MQRKRNGIADLIDQIIDGVGDAIADVRIKLLDEGWFGRRAAPPSQFEGTDLGWTQGTETQQSLGGALTSQQGFEESWAVRDPADPHERSNEEVEFDLDR